MMKVNTSVRVVFATAALALMAVASGQAWGVTHENKLTFSGAVSLPGVVLPAGAYSFDLLASESRLDVVIVRNARRQVMYTGFTTLVTRPPTLPGKATITFGEALPNVPPPVAVWYPIGENYGHEFRYHR